MAYIEDIMDIYGRQLIVQTAKDAGLDAEKSLESAHHKLDTLRAALDGAFRKNPEGNPDDLRAAIDEAAKRLKNNWGTRE